MTDPFIPTPPPTALRVTVGPATIRRIEALGFVPGSGDIVGWLCDEIERSRALVPAPEVTRG